MALFHDRRADLRQCAAVLGRWCSTRSFLEGSQPGESLEREHPLDVRRRPRPAKGRPGDGAQDVDDVGVVPELRIASYEYLLWVVVGPQDATSLTVPQPPTGFEAGATTLDVSLWLGRPAPDSEGYEAWAIMEPFSAGA